MDFKHAQLLFFLFFFALAPKCMYVVLFLYFVKTENVQEKKKNQSCGKFSWNIKCNGQNSEFSNEGVLWWFGINFHKKTR